MADEQDVPEGRLSRFARLAAVSARGGASALLRRDGEATAKRAAEVLGTMRGVAAKVGQMAGYVDGVVPEGQREAYEKWMKTLMAQAPRSPREEIFRTLEEELGGKPSELFEEFSDDPVASASIGQVHRAQLKDGTDVAVKVQHAGIRKAVESDLKNAGLMESALAVMGTRKFESKRVLKEVRDRFREELDYTLEAQRQARFGEIHAGDAMVRIPRVFTSHSSSRVITSEWVEGKSLEEARDFPEETRVKFAEHLWRFVFKGTIVGGLFNADPHPGNYFFHDDGAVTFIDFGCVQPLEPERRKIARGLHWGAILRDDAMFDRACRGLMELRGGAYEKAALSYVRQAFDPVYESPYRVDRAYVISLVERMKTIALEARKAKGDQFVPMPEGMVFMNRLQFGFYSVLARLEVTADYREVERQFLEAADLPPGA